MARNTERPIPIQEGIEISLAENLLKVSGKNGDLSMSIHPSVTVSYTHLTLPTILRV